MRIHRLLLLCGLAAASLAARAGNRTLQTPTLVNTGSIDHLGFILAGDFTGDGKPDVLVSERSYSERKIRVTAGLGNGTFSLAVVTDPAGFIPKGAADFNGDGVLDLYLLNGAGGIGVMFGAGNGSFAPPTAVPGPVPADAIVAGDFNGDTLTDLAIVSEGQVSIVMVPGSGAGTSAIHGSFAPLFQGEQNALAGDFDGDGLLDLAMYGSNGATIAWNNGTSFVNETTVDYSVVSAGAGDVNGDGITDLVASDQARSAVRFGKSTRGLTGATLPGTALNVSSQGVIAVATLHGDGRADIIGGGGAVTVLTHDGTAFRTPRSFGIGDTTVALAAADFDLDGKTDIAGLPGGQSLDYFCVVRGKSDASLHADVAFDVAGSVGTLGWGKFIADVNGDSELDIVVVTYLENEIAVLFGHGDGTFDPPIFTTLPDSSYGSVHEASDLNGDGRIDVVLWEPAGEDTRFSIFFSQVNGTFVAGPVQTSAKIIGNYTRLLPIVDYTRDGKPDLFEETGMLHPGLGNGAFGTPINTGIDTWADEASAVDIDGDSHVDLLVMRGSWLSSYISTGAGTFATPVVSEWSGIGLSAADVNDDGLVDLTSPEFALGVGDGTFSYGAINFDVSLSVAADFDGDGKMDLGEGAAIYFGTGTGAFDDATQFRATGSTVSVGDLDHDGSADLWRMQNWLTIVRPGLGDEGTMPSQLELSTPINPMPFGSFGALVARPAPPSIATRARGAVLFSIPPAAPFRLALVDADGTAKWPVQAPAIDGSVTYASTFTGDSLYLPSSSSSLTVTSTRATTTTTVSTSRSIYEIGQNVVIGAQVRGGMIAPTGNIIVRKDGTVLRNLAAPGGSFSTIDVAIFPIGTHTLTAEYEGSANYLPSVSVTRTITIKKVTPTMTLALSPSGPYTHNQQVTLTASFPNHADASGSVTFNCFGQTLGTAVISSATAVLSGPMPWGDGYCGASYSGSEKYDVAGATSSSLTVYYGTMSTPPLVSATPLPGTQIVVSISPISGATHYDIYRSLDGAPLVHIFTTHTTSYNVSLPAGTKVAVFAAAAKNTSTGVITAVGPRDFASFATFTDDPIVASTTSVKAIHITELQNAINALRVAAGLTTTTFSSPNGVISAAQLTSLRTAITQARAAFGMATPLTDPTITAGVTPIRAVHLQELRNGVR